MKRILAGLLILMVALAPAGALAAGEEAPTPEPVESGAPAESTNPIETQPTDEPDAPQSSGTLSIDDKNVYEGMEKPYRSGYAPTVKDGKVTIVLPLLAETDVGKLTVTPNLGDPASAPFVFKSYQKTVKQSQQKINGAKDTKEIYYIRFDLNLSKKRMNGTYPVVIDVQGKEVMQSFTTYVTVTDGKDPNAEPSEPVAAEPKPESQPILIVSGSKISPEKPKAGGKFTADVELRNTNEKKSVKNMTVTVTTDNPLVSLTEDSNTFYFEKFEKGHTETLTLHFQAGTATPPGKYNITLAMSYDNTDATTLTSSGTVQVEVVQPLRVELSAPQIPETVNAGDTLPLSFQVMNLGRGGVYNVRCEIAAPGLMPTGTAFLGNMEAGTSATADVNVFIGTKDMSEGSTETEKYGYTSGAITLIYEDDSGEEYRETFEITTSIAEPVIDTSAADQEEAEKKQERQAGQWWISVAIGGAAILIIGVALLLRKRKKRHETEE